MNRPSPTVAIACTGLGHVRRGNETWALDVARALHHAGESVLLLGGGPCPEADCPYLSIPNLRREFPLLRRWVPWSKRYLAEQLSFLPFLKRTLSRRGISRVHLCDPDLALQLSRRTDPNRLRVAFKDGMRLGPEWCRRLPFVQVLAPYYRDVLAREAGVDTTRWFVVPHLVDPAVFRPAPDRRAARAAWPELGLPADAFVVAGVGDFSADSHKRLSWLVQEVGALPASTKAHLILAGQATAAQAALLQSQGLASLGPRLHLLPNRPRTEVARLYAVADVYAHAATAEPFGIVLLEALASGLPVAGHTWEVTRWIVGDGGTTVDMTAPGALASVLRDWSAQPARLAELGIAARRRAVDAFSAARIVPLYREMYARMTRP